MLRVNEYTAKWETDNERRKYENDMTIFARDGIASSRYVWDRCRWKTSSPHRHLTTPFPT